MSDWHQLIKNDPAWKEARQLCLERDDWTCVECEATEDLEVDHIVPLSVVLADEATAYLATDLDNLQTLCKPCNGRKLDRQANNVVRQLWISPKYPEAATAIVGGF